MATYVHTYYNSNIKTYNFNICFSIGSNTNLRYETSPCYTEKDIVNSNRIRFYKIDWQNKDRLIETVASFEANGVDSLVVCGLMGLGKTGHNWVMCLW